MENALRKEELVLIEGSRNERDRYIEKVEVLEKVKKIVLFDKTDKMTTEMVADYYEVPVGTIKSLVSDNNEELVSDGYITYSKQSLKELKGELGNPTNLKFVSNLALFPRKSILRVGMLLRDSKVAKEVRDYLLNSEEATSSEHKVEIINEMFEQLNQNFTKSNENLIKVIQNDNLYVIERLDKNENEIIKSRQELTNDLEKMNERLEKIENLFVFKQYENPIHRFEVSLTKYAIHTNSNRRYYDFYRDLENWLEIKLPRNQNYTIKEYILSEIGIDTIECFIDGVISGRIIKSKQGWWVDQNGVFSNTVEWNKIKNQFNNRCAYCESEGVLIAEHIIPQSNVNTTDQIKNIVPACKSCNKSKDNKDVKEWYPKQDYYTDERILRMGDHWNKYDIKN